MYRISAKVRGGLCLYSVIKTAATAILAWYGTSCGIESNIDGDENEVDNKIQKGFVNMDFSSSGEGSCEVWEGLGFRVFKWLCIIIMIIVFSYWLIKKCTGKKRVHQEMETTQRKDKVGEDRENESRITQAGFNS